MRSTLPTLVSLLAVSMVACAEPEKPTGVLEGGLVPPPVAVVVFVDGLISPPTSGITVRIGTRDTLIVGTEFRCRTDGPLPGHYYIYQRFGVPTAFSLVFHLRRPDSSVVADTGLALPAIPWDRALWVEVQPNVGNPFPPVPATAHTATLPMVQTAMRSSQDSLWVRWFERPQEEVFNRCR